MRTFRWIDQHLIKDSPWANRLPRVSPAAHRRRAPRLGLHAAWDLVAVAAHLRCVGSFLQRPVNIDILQSSFSEMLQLSPNPPWLRTSIRSGRNLTTTKLPSGLRGGLCCDSASPHSCLLIKGIPMSGSAWRYRMAARPSSAPARPGRKRPIRPSSAHAAPYAKKALGFL